MILNYKSYDFIVFVDKELSSRQEPTLIRFVGSSTSLPGVWVTSVFKVRGGRPVSEKISWIMNRSKLDISIANLHLLGSEEQVIPTFLPIITMAFASLTLNLGRILEN